MVFFFLLVTLSFSYGYPGICASSKEECSWFYDAETKQLTVRGTGQMFNCSTNEFAPWHYYHDQIEKATIEGFSSIGDYAFFDCKSLKEVVVSTGVTLVGEGAFYNCISLKTISLPNTVNEIGRNAFSYCKSLLNFVIPNDVTTLEPETFSHCHSLLKVSIPTSLTVVGNNAFSNCVSLISVAIPNSVTEIGYGAFSYCLLLREITLPNTLSVIEFETFKRCEQLEKLTIPQSLTSIGHNAFEYCFNLKRVEIPFTSKLNTVSETAFFSRFVETLTITGSGPMNEYLSSNYQHAPWRKLNVLCSNLIIDDKITTIGSYSFYDFNKFNLLFIPQTVKSFGSNFLTVGYNLKTIYYGGISEPSCSSDFSGSQIDVMVLSSYGSLNFCSKKVNKTGFEGICGDYCSWKVDSSFSSMTITGSGVMNNFGYGNTPWKSFKCLLKEVVIEGLTTIGEGAFYDSVLLNSVTIPNYLTTIGSSAFYNCGSLKSISIPSSVTSFGSFSFYNCWSLQTITIPEGLKEIPSLCLHYCSRLTSITIPNSVNAISSQAFTYCVSLESIDISNSPYVGSEAFRECRSLKTIKISEFLSSFDQKVFANCSSLESIDIPGKLDRVCEFAFSGTTSLKNFVFKEINGFGFVYNNSFENSGIEKIVMQNSYRNYYDFTIGEYAFSNCWNLKYVEIMPQVTEGSFSLDGKDGKIMRYAFYNCPNIKTFIINRFIGAVGEYAFSFNGEKSVRFEYNSKSSPLSCSNYDSNFKDYVIQPIFSDNVETVYVPNNFESKYFCKCDKLGCLAEYVDKNEYFSSEEVSVPISKTLNPISENGTIKISFIIAAALLLMII